MRHNLFLGAAVAALVIPAAASAQEITTGIQGTVKTEAGAPVGGATVTITDTRTGTTRNIETSADGTFSANGLVTGGPYSLSAVATGYEGQTLQNITTSLAGATNVEFSLAKGAGDIIVTGSRARVTQLAIGPGQSFGTQAMEASSSFLRDIRDVLRIDPRVSLNRDSEIDRVSCLGGNDRFNTFTVDGIVQADVYGLNNTPFASRGGQPIPFDAIRETQVEFAPFDVQYGQFSGCAINVVTKSGTNDYHFGGFYEYTDPGLGAKSVYDTLRKSARPTVNPTAKDWGANFSAPIIKDKLFLFGAYEETNKGLSQDLGPAGDNYGTPVANVTAAQFNAISAIAKSVYGIDSGPLVHIRPATSRRFFGRADWYITTGQRLEVTYQRLEESTLVADDYFDAPNAQITGANSFFTSGTKSDYFSGRLYSNWNDKFSTEIRYSKSLVTDQQDPLGGGEAQSSNPITRLIVGVDNNPNFGAVQFGPGTSRSANALTTKIDQYKIKGTYHAGDHTITLGGEANVANIFNLFVQNATGTLVFKNINDFTNGVLETGSGTSTSSAANIQAGNVIAGAFINATASGDVTTAAANFKRTIWTAYAQDSWKVTPDFTVVGGIRTDWYSGDHPIANPVFFQKYGFSNSSGFSNIDPVISPRVGFTWNAGDHGAFERVQLKGGLGIFSGGDPTVWFGNAFQNNGFAFATGTSKAAGCPATISVVTAGKFTGFPTCVVANAKALAASSNGFVNNFDPDFKTPTVLRGNLGFGTDVGVGTGFFGRWHVALDYIYSLYRNPANIVDLSETLDIRTGVNGTGRTITGQPIYATINPIAAGCGARLVQHGTPPVYTGVTLACFNNATSGEYELTNAGDYRNHVISLVLSKNFNRGVFTPGGSVFFNVGYAYTDSHDRRNMYNTTASSNYNTTAEYDYQNPEATTSFYQTKHNITVSGNFKERFLGDYATTLGFVFNARSGRPYSLAFTNTSVFNPSFVSANGALLYIPTGVDDPNIVKPVVGSAAETAVNNLVNYANNLDCAKKYIGKVVERNACENPWYFDLDLTFSQELPGPGHLFGRDDKIRIYAGIDNFLNLLDSSWNVYRQRDFAGRQGLAAATVQAGTGKYNFSSFTTANDVANIGFSASAWRLKIGAAYNF